MKKLKLEHLAPYLPYKLKYQLKGNYPVIKGVENIIEDIREINPFDFTLKKVLDWETCKPILRPLSDLTKEMFEGKFNELYIVQFYTIIQYPNIINLNELNYFVIQKLFEWHFDCFNLISKGLAIDVNSLSENPYK